MSTLLLYVTYDVCVCDLWYLALTSSLHEVTHAIVRAIGSGIAARYKNSENALRIAQNINIRDQQLVSTSFIEVATDGQSEN